MKNLKLKEKIRKKIEFKNNKIIYVEQQKMNDRDRLRIYGKPQKKVIDYGTYGKNVDVDVDVIFCVSSFNRYKKIENILKQVFTQKTKYTFKFILMNDGSTDEKYDNLKYIFPDILYLKNEMCGGKINYWRTVNALWEKAKEFKTHAIIQLDDDFILCENFLDILLDTFFEVKYKNNAYMIFTFHLYSFEKNKPIESWWFNEKDICVDGGMLIDVQFMKKINYYLDKIQERVKINSSSFTWVRVKERLLEFEMKIYRFQNSLVWHTGNDDSKLHPNIRHKKRVYTKNFIDKIDIENEQ